MWDDLQSPRERAVCAPPGRFEFLPFHRPAIDDEEIGEVAAALRSGWITTGPRTRQFEEAFAAYVHAPAALALSSCTAGLHVALIAAGIGRGDEVITTTLTFTASVNVIEHVGARPMLVDVEPDTLNLDPAAVESALSRHTRAVLPVHFAGHPVDLAAIQALAVARRLTVLEDAAHALPATYAGRHVGSGSNPACFSFYATKNLTTGEGGMLTGDPELVARARVLSLHGMSQDAWRRYDAGGHWAYEVLRPGFKYNMTDVQAALGNVQLRKLASFQQRRREIVAAYTAAFHDCDALIPPVERAGVEHAWHLYVLRLRPEALRIDRDRVIEELAARNIGTSVHFIPIHLHPYYREKYGYSPTAFPVAYENYRCMLSLPLYPRLTDADVGDVIDAVLDTVRRHRR